MRRATFLVLTLLLTISFQGAPEARGNGDPAKKIAKYIKRFKSYENRARDAATILVNMGKSVIPQVLGTLSAKAWKKRYWALWTLRYLKDVQKSVAAMVKPLVKGDPHPRVRLMAAAVLGKLGDRGGIEVVRSLCANQKTKIRREAVRALGKIGGARALTLVKQALNDSREKVRYAALISLGEIGDLSTLNLALSYLHDRSAKIRYAALEACTMAVDMPRAIKKVARLIKDRSKKVRHQAIGVLARIGDKSVLAELRKIRDARKQPRYIRNAADAAVLLIMKREKENGF